MITKPINLLTSAVMGLTISVACNSAMAASVALSVNEISNFSMSSTGVTFTGFTFSNDTAATESGGTGGANTSDASAACIGDCQGWENQFYAHDPYSTEFSYGDAQIINDNVLSGVGSASSIGEAVVTDGIAHASGSNVLTSIYLSIADSTTLDFSLYANSLMETSVSGSGVSSAANMFFSLTLTDAFNNTAFLWNPDELNRGIAGNSSYVFSDVLTTQTGALTGGNYTLNIKMENQVNAVSVVPVPAAVWLFGSGLIGLAGFARRKKA